MKNKMWGFSSVVTEALETLKAEVAAGVTTGHSTGDLFWKHETKYGGRKTVRGGIGKQKTKKETRHQWRWPQAPQAHFYLALVDGYFSSLHREAGKP